MWKVWWAMGIHFQDHLIRQENPGRSRPTSRHSQILIFIIFALISLFFIFSEKDLFIYQD
jgi:hypothetical protein